MLLPDGRVVSSGGGHPEAENGGTNNFNAEIFSPPYLFKGARPVISSAPSRALHGQSFTVSTNNPSSIRKVHLIRQTTVTHSTNMDQRLSALAFSVVSGGVRVTIPSNANVVPPGPYMLFIVNSAGVPSVAKLMLIGNQPPVAKCRDVIVDASSSCTASVSSASINKGSFDPEGGAVTCSLGSSGPFGVGSNPVQLNCTDPSGGSGFCTAQVHVNVGDNPACCPAGTNVSVGTSSGNSIAGTEGSDCILGLGGDDTIDGRGGNDFISGGSGRDTIVGGFGNDFITSGSGDDTIDSGPDNDKVGAGSGRDNITAGPGDDIVDGGTEFDTCFVPSGNDVVLSCEN